ncbi:VanZ family protein [Tepidimonas sp.]|uniref:VanZ family protein n=1 Tax=Tepidimonas sp. TaxID=2002775 RepID=UPI00391961AC
MSAQPWRLAFLVVLGGVTLLSLLPPRHLPDVAFDVWDKAQHALAYAGLALLARLGWPRAPWPALAAALLAHGAVIELAQHASGWRQGDPLDWLADAVGVAAALAVLSARRRRATTG